ncbi:MAG: dihydrolipoyl dehydrogenase [Bdellovibrionaceae bacterium]|nr:dihydrolipoyl dehydrogenase [Pseudobdellovibrionaceae bacterium]NUM60199.1 dihydrolipoyl dehydrogenase [Pseudobdellovibrionaceae bacterium]
MQKFDVVVVGSGPGGYVAAIKCAQLGLNTAIIEKEALGGVCLNVGCIPSKAMITAAHWLDKMENDFPQMGFEVSKPKVDFKKLLSWKQSVCERMSTGVSQLLKGNKVTIFKGEGQFQNANQIKVISSDKQEVLEAKYFILAMGSRPIQIPGFEFDEKNIVSSTGALAWDQAPKRLVTIGGGYIGLEISSYLKKFGTEVTVVEAQTSLLAGVVDPECAQVVSKRLNKKGVQVLFNAKAKGQKKIGNEYEVTVEINGKDQTIKTDKVLVTVGRRPNGDQAHLKNLGVQVDERGFVKVDAQRRTNLRHVFAIGDLCGQPMLAHKASHEGVMVAEIIGGKNRAYDVKTVPAVVFTDPEIASAGVTEAEAIAKGYKNLKISKFPFAANGRAVSMLETDGFVKMIADENDILLGVHIVGPEASNLISEAALAIEMGARLQDLALTIHPHPTLGETMMEAAEATLGHAIHIIQKPLNNKTSVTTPTKTP